MDKQIGTINSHMRSKSRIRQTSPTDYLLCVDKDVWWLNFDLLVNNCFIAEYDMEILGGVVALALLLFLSAVSICGAFWFIGCSWTHFRSIFLKLCVLGRTRGYAEFSVWNLNDLSILPNAFSLLFYTENTIKSDVLRANVSKNYTPGYFS